MIFIDASIPLALVGDDPRTKDEAHLLLEREITAHSRMVTDAAVLQEILHHCAVVGAREAVEPAVEALLGVVDEVLSVEEPDAVRAKEMLYGPEGLSPRCCLHLSVMERHGVRRVMSFDPELDRYPEVTRLGRS